MTSKQTDAALEASAAELGLHGTKMADLEAEAAAAAAAAAPKADYASSRQGDAALEASAQSLGLQGKKMSMILAEMDEEERQAALTPRAAARKSQISQHPEHLQSLNNVKMPPGWTAPRSGPATRAELLASRRAPKPEGWSPPKAVSVLPEDVWRPGGSEATGNTRNCGSVPSDEPWRPGGSNASGNTRNADSVPGGVIAPAPPPAVEPPKSPPSRVFGDAAPAAPSAARDGSPTSGLIRDHPTRPGVATIKAHTEALGS